MISENNTFSSYFNSGLKLDSIMSVSEWADENRILSQTASSEPGRFRTSRTPYLKEIMDALSPSSPYERVVFMKGAQIGGTEAGNNWIGYVISQAPGPMLVVQPTVEMGKRWSKGRLAPLINDTECLRNKVKDPRSRDSGNTVQSKEFQGGQIVITGANSAVGLRSMPVRYLFCDEVDAYPPSADNEGDPLILAIQRTATFSRRKIFIVSTPTIKGLSRIEKEFENSDQRYYFVPCPFCGHYQTLRWENIRYDNNFSEVTYVCENCKGGIQNHHKTEMLTKGEWRAVNLEATTNKIIGFHLSSLYSPVGWMSWEQCARNYEAAKDDEQLLKAWTNTTLGMTWEEKGEAPDWGVLFDRREKYRIGKVPLEAGTWQKLSNILAETFESEDGIRRNINMLAVDTGFCTQEVYSWIRGQSGHNVMAVKGTDNSLVPLNAPTKVDVNYRGRKISNGVRLWKVGVSILKGELYGWLKRTKNEDGSAPTGYMHFPEYATEYFKQLTAEQLVTKIVKGYPKREWQKTRDRNEALDCRVYARAAAIALGIDRWSDKKWEQLTSASKEKETNRPQKPRVIKSRWM